MTNKFRYPDCRACDEINSETFSTPEEQTAGEAAKQQDLKKGTLGTSIKIKREGFDKFVELIRNQFEHGGAKYGAPDENTREFTDLICDSFPGDSGVDWVLGTMMKYLGRFKNFRREKDLLKVATYCYIAWLKFGFHLEEKHDEDIFITDAGQASGS